MQCSVIRLDQCAGALLPLDGLNEALLVVGHAILGDIYPQADLRLLEEVERCASAVLGCNHGSPSDVCA